MTVTEYRNTHRKCKYCQHLHYITLPPFATGPDTWCNAKMTIVNDDIPRPFCKVFQVRGDDTKEGNDGE